MNEKRVYIFDLDGTLADSMPTAVKIVLSLLDEKGIAYPDDIVKTLTPLGFKGIAKYYAEILHVPMPAEEIFAWFLEKLQRAYDEEISLKSTVKQTLIDLKRRGARLCVLTGSPHSFTDALLKREGIYSLFERVWSAEDFGLPKSDGRIYQKIARELGVATEELLLVDDGLEVLKTAKAAGVKIVGAYDEYSASLEELREVAENYIFELSQLL